MTQFCEIDWHHSLGVGAHKDYGFLAVLAQDDVGGLEVGAL